MSLQESTPDHLYCHRCHAVAAGTCATCQALICADCAELSGGATKKIAVCLDCHQQGRGQLGLSDWMLILKPIGIALVGLVLLALALVPLLR